MITDNNKKLEGKTLRCSKCEADVFIPSNQVGGFWHLSGWVDINGVKHWGSVCPPCFRKLSGKEVVQ